MRILIDECIPRKLKNHLPGHYCQTVQKAGLAGKKNGQLLAIADQMGFDVLLTMDKSIQYQQSIAGRRIAIVAFRATSNRLGALLPLIPACLSKLAASSRYHL